MSGKRSEKQSYAIVERMREIWETSRASSQGRFLLTLIASYADKNGISRPSRETLSELSGFSTRYIRDILSELTELGEVHVRGQAYRGRCKEFVLPEWRNYSATFKGDVKGDVKGGVKGGTIAPPKERSREVKEEKEREGTAPIESDAGVSLFAFEYEVKKCGYDPEVANAWYAASKCGTVDAHGRKIKKWQEALRGYVEAYSPRYYDTTTLADAAAELGYEDGSEEHELLSGFYAEMQDRAQRHNGVWHAQGRPVENRIALFEKWTECDTDMLSWIGVCSEEYDPDLEVDQ